MIQSIEILVHISAPSRGIDDARYRRQARELLGFEPARTHGVLPLQGRSSGDYETSSKQEAVEKTNKTPSRRPVGSVNDVSSSLLERFEKTTPYGVTTPCVEENASRLLMPPPVGTSIVDASAPSRATKATPQLHIHRTPALPRRCTTPKTTTPSKDVKHPRQIKSDLWRTPPSVIPDSQPTYPTSSKRPNSSSPCFKRDLSHISPTPSSSPTPTRTPNSTSTPRKKRHRIKSAQPNPPPSPTKTPDFNLISSLLLPTNFPSSTSTITSLALPLEIHPPPPPPSQAKFTTHLTLPLQNLSLMLPHRTLFRPTTQTRPLQKLERGHWHVPLKPWSENIRVKFWAFLREFVGGGKGGWGVWCSMETVNVEKARTEIREERDKREEEGSGEEEVVVKIYSWGEVVPEIWLLLWLASSQHIVNLSARWIDAGGEVVLAMR